MCIHGQDFETCSFGCTFKIAEGLRLENDQLQDENKHLRESVKTMDVLSKQIVELHEALDTSIKFQSHYAELLNMHDGGERIIFKNSEQWIKRLQAPQEKGREE